ncbi:MAG: ferrous iron transport protein A [Clostridia bacterium]|nr:ferrous iron transport protein A [Clostridia bacterium]
MPLHLAEPGRPQIVRRVGGSPEVKKHLEDLGFTVGCEVTVVNSLAGNIIVKIRDSRLALGKDLAGKILV